MPQVTAAPHPRPQTTPKTQSTRLPVFDIFDFTPVQTGNLLGFFSVRIGREPTAVTIHKGRLIQQPGQAAWISLPQEIWVDDTGKRRYKTLVEIPKPWREPLTNAVIAAWEQHQQEGGEPR